MDINRTILLPRGGGKTHQTATAISAFIRSGKQALVIGGGTLGHVIERLQPDLQNLPAHAKSPKIVHFSRVQDARGLEFDGLFVHELSYDWAQTRGESPIIRSYRDALVANRGGPVLIVDDLDVVTHAVPLFREYARISHTIDLLWPKP